MKIPRSNPVSPFSETYRHAESQWFEGEFSAAIATLNNGRPTTSDEHADAHLLMARALLRLGDYERAFVMATAAADKVSSADVDRTAAAAMLNGAALARLGRADEARVHFERGAARKKAHRTILAEIALERARLAYQCRGLDDDSIVMSRRFLVEALAKAEDIVLARAQELMGFINVFEMKYADAARSFRQALATLHGSAHRDMLLEANVVHQATMLAAERMDVALMPMAVQAADRIGWSEDMAEARFQVAQNVGWLALVGDRFEDAWRWFHAALAAVSDDPAYRLMALTNLATLHRLLGEPFSAAHYLSDAESWLERVDWAAVHADRRTALLEWIVEARRQNRDVTAARLDAYPRQPAGDGLKSLDRNDPRAAALFDTARGLIESSAGKSRVRSLRIIERAIASWASVGFRYRAATLALDAYRLTGDRKYLDLADEQTRTMKSSAIRNAVRQETRKESIGLTNLTPADRAMLYDIIAGKSAAQIAQESNRALQTVKNITYRMYKKLGVDSRAQLIVACARLGIRRPN